MPRQRTYPFADYPLMALCAAETIWATIQERSASYEGIKTRSNRSVSVCRRGRPPETLTAAPTPYQAFPPPFAWGRKGPGTAALAYSVLLDFTHAPAFASHSSLEFAHEVIEKLPRRNFLLTADRVLSWVRPRLHDYIALAFITTFTPIGTPTTLDSFEEVRKHLDRAPPPTGRPPLNSQAAELVICYARFFFADTPAAA